MKIEKIFQKVPSLSKIKLDKVLFEAKYPVLFTCKDDNGIYLFICFFVNFEKMEWIGTKTSYDNLIDLLENKVTIRDAFLNVTSDKMLITYNGDNVTCEIKESRDIPEEILPTAGEYMDAEDGEFDEEIAAFKEQNQNIEYII